MFRLHPAVPHGDREVEHVIHAYLLETLDTAHDIEHGIDRAHFVQVHRVGGDPVYSPFSGAKELECLHTLALDAR